MNNALYTSPVMTSFKVLWQWLMAKPGQPLQATPLPVDKPKWVDTPAPVNGLAQQRNQVVKASAAPGRPVRVLQVMEAGQSPTQAGRLRISGRMADVCAELDRLAAREALQH
jgi:hypothetical protein